MNTYTFDIDGVLADFIGGFTTLASKTYKNVPYSTVHQKLWGKFAGLSEKEEHETWNVVDQMTDFWATLPTLLTTAQWDKLCTLNLRSNVYFATNRRGKDPLDETKSWLESFGVYRPNVVLTKFKGEFCRVVNARYMIDDKADNASCIAWNSERTGGITIPYLLARKYNEYNDQNIGSRHVRRIESIDTFLDLCLKEVS